MGADTALTHAANLTRAPPALAQTLMIMDSVNGAFIGILPLESHDQVFRAGGARQGWTSVMFM